MSFEHVTNGAPSQKEPEWLKYSMEGYRELDKEPFDKLIKRWCNKNNYMEYVEEGRKIPTRLPYKFEDGNAYIAKDFMEMYQKHLASSVFTAT